MFCFVSSSQITEAQARARLNERKVAALRKRKKQEQQVVALHSSPPPTTLQSKKAKKATSGSKVLKTHTAPGVGTKTPTRAARPPRSVTPAAPSGRESPPSVTNTGSSDDDDDETVQETILETSTFARSFFTQDESSESLPEAKLTLDQEDLTDHEAEDTAHEDIATMPPANISPYKLDKLQKELESTKEQNLLLEQQLAHQGKELNDANGQYDELLKKYNEEKKKGVESNQGGVSTRAFDAVKSDLEKARKEAKSSKTAYAMLVKKYNAKKELVTRLQAKIQELESAEAPEPSSDAKKLQKEIHQVRQENVNLTGMVDKLKKTVQEAVNELKKKGKSLECEVASDVLQPAKDALKEIVYRTTKIVSSKKPEELKKMTRAVYNLIKDERGFEDEDSPDDLLSFDDFHRIYKDKLMTYFNSIRQQTQTACSNAVTGTYIHHDHSYLTLFHL